MNHPRRIRRFPRRQSDAHLVTPPDITPYTYDLVVDEVGILNATGPHRLSNLLAAEFGCRSNAPFNNTSRHLMHDGHALRIAAFEQMSERNCIIRITRRPKLSPKLLANRTPLQRQRLRQQSQSCQ